MFLAVGTMKYCIYYKYFLFNLIITPINRLNLISLLNASSSNYNYAPVTDTSQWKTKNDHEMAQIYNNIDKDGSNVECSDLYQQTWFQCSTSCSASELQKHPNLAHVCRVLGPLSSAYTIPMLGYVTALYLRKYLDTGYTEYRGIAWLFIPV